MASLFCRRQLRQALGHERVKREAFILECSPSGAKVGGEWGPERPIPRTLQFNFRLVVQHVTLASRLGSVCRLLGQSISRLLLLRLPIPGCPN